MPKIRLYINKSLEENASMYFQKSKVLKKKLMGAERIVEEMKKKQNELAAKEAEKAKEASAVQSEKHRRKAQWYEKFRWFISSEGFLVIGGRDATTNEIIIKKHAEEGDLIFHTDMTGSPFFVVKAGSSGRSIGSATIKEAASATCTFSRAWKLGLSGTDVFYVHPSQVTKQANPGEYLSKGAFMIRGKTNYVDNMIDAAVGTYKGAVMAGPYEAVKKNCGKAIRIVQGKEKPSQVAKLVKKELGADIDEIIRALPSGGMSVSGK